jgi:hypothetical protein
MAQCSMNQAQGQLCLTFEFSMMIMVPVTGFWVVTLQSAKWVQIFWGVPEGRGSMIRYSTSIHPPDVMAL